MANLMVAVGIGLNHWLPFTWGSETPKSDTKIHYRDLGREEGREIRRWSRQTFQRE